MTSDELAERVDTIGRVRDLLDMPRDEITEARQIDYELADLSPDLLSVLDDVAEGLAKGDAAFEAEHGYSFIEQWLPPNELRDAVRAVRDLHQRTESE